MKNNEDIKKCISCGKCQKKYCFLILGVFSVIAFDLLFVILIRKLEVSQDTHDWMFSLFFVNLGELLMIIPNLILKKNISQKKDNATETKNNSTIELYIFNNNSVEFSRKDKISIIMFTIIKLILDLIYFFYFMIFRDANNYLELSYYSFKFEFIFLFILSIIIYKVKLYKHQYFSIIILTIIQLA